MATIAQAHRLHVRLSETLGYTWQFHPEPERIVQDVTRWPITLEQIIQHKGGVAPNHAGTGVQPHEARRVWGPDARVASA
jgi:hypothetical protein